MLKVTRKKPHQLTFPLIMTGAALVLIIFSVLLLSRFGPTAYFVLTGKPLDLHGSDQPKVHAQSLPHFRLTGSVAKKQLAIGDTQTITITAKADMPTAAIINAWISSPTLHKQVWQSPAGTVIKFPTNKTVVSTYQYAIKPTLPKTRSAVAYILPPGTYKLSAVIVSTDGYTDYAAKENLAEFTVQ